MKTTSSISATSCWVLKLKGTFLMMDSFHFKVHKMLDGSTRLVQFFFTVMLRLTVCNITNKLSSFEGTLFQRLGTILKICKMEFTEQVLPLLMKPTSWTEFAFTGLVVVVVCLRDDREDGELQAFFWRIIELPVGSRSRIFIVFGQPDTKRAFCRRPA